MKLRGEGYVHKLFSGLVVPDELIQKDSNGVSNRMLLLNKDTGEMKDLVIKDLPDLLEADDTIVINTSMTADSKVYTPEGGYVVLVNNLGGGFMWDILVDDYSKCPIGSKLTFSIKEKGGYVITGTIIDSSTDRSRIILLSEGTRKRTPEETARALYTIGEPLLPSYAYGNWPSHPVYVNKNDRSSLCIQTAGSKLTKSVMSKILARKAEISLTTGLAGYRTIDIQDYSRYVMDSESYSIPKESASVLNSTLGKKISIGCGALRAVESAVGYKGKVRSIERGSTNLFLSPNKKAEVCTGLLSKFNVPGSAGMVAQGSLCDPRLLMKAYSHAIKEEYKFFEFGDVLLII